MTSRRSDELVEAFEKLRCIDVTVKLRLTEKEASRLTELAKLKDLSVAKLLLQALRLYDGVENGNPELKWKKDPNFYKGFDGGLEDE